MPAGVATPRPYRRGLHTIGGSLPTRGKKEFHEFLGRVWVPCFASFSVLTNYPRGVSLL